MNSRMLPYSLLAVTVLWLGLVPLVRGDDRDKQQRPPQRGDHTRGSVTYGRGGERDRGPGGDRDRRPGGDRDRRPGDDRDRQRDRDWGRGVESRDRWGHRIEFGVDVDREHVRRIEFEVNRRHPREVRPIPRGTCVVDLPRGARTVVVGRTTYYEADGVFFERGPGVRTYVVVRPPVGAVVTAIPEDYQVVVIENRPYYVCEDTYFDMDLHVVEIPVGGYIYTLPPEFKIDVVHGEKYFSFSGGFFRPFLRGGRTVYVRVDIRR